jgi:hypothetical protein
MRARCRGSHESEAMAEVSGESVCVVLAHPSSLPDRWPVPGRLMGYLAHPHGRKGVEWSPVRR